MEFTEFGPASFADSHTLRICGAAGKKSS